MSIISQFGGCFKNQTIIYPLYESSFSYPLMEEESYPLNNYLFRIWTAMFFFTCYSMGWLMYRLFCAWYCEGYSEGYEGYTGPEGKSDVVDDMRAMMREISELSDTERQERSENYYILTNLLVNRFRIEVYEKILK